MNEKILESLDSNSLYSELLLFSAVLLAFICGINANYIFMIFVLVIGYKTYLHNEGLGVIVLTTGVIGKLFLNIMQGYIFALIVIIGLILIQLIHIASLNLDKYISYILLLSNFAYMSIINREIYVSSILAIVSYIIFTNLDIKKISNNQKVDFDYYLLPLLIIISSFNGVFFNELTYYIIIGFLFLIAYKGSIKSLIVYSVILYFVYQFKDVEIIAALLLVMILKEDRLFTILPLVIVSIFYNDIYISGICLCLFILMLFMKEEVIIGDDYIQMSNMQKYINKQLHNYSQIFNDLSLLYDNKSNIESKYLKQMSSALTYCSNRFQYNVDFTLPRKERLLAALNTYKFEIGRFSLEELDNNDVLITMNIKKITKRDLSEVIIPIFELILDNKLDIIEDSYSKYFGVYHKIVLQTKRTFKVLAGGINIGIEEGNADNFSTFKFNSNTVCMISDGMGNSNEANIMSLTVLNILQRLVSSNVPIDVAINCVNELVKDELFTTLDVLSIDESLGKAYISKSCASPTYLMRNSNITKIESASLPIGMLDEINPECYILNIMKGDLFLMASDGISEEEVYDCFNEAFKDSLSGSLNNISSKLMNKIRNDASTLIMAKVI